MEHKVQNKKMYYYRSEVISVIHCWTKCKKNLTLMLIASVNYGEGS